MKDTLKSCPFCGGEAPKCWDKECSKGYHVCCYFCEERPFCPEACDDDVCAEGKMDERINR